MRVIGVIPARYGSSRLPGKPLKDICGKPMIWWVYERVSKAKRIDNVIVATDDERIVSVLKDYDIPHVMTRSDHPTAANRIAEVAEKVSGDFYLQLNGDEPLIDEKLVDRVVPEEVVLDVEFGTNIITKMLNPAEVNDQSNIKVVFDCNYHALYMSRFPIPAPAKEINFCYYKHVGIIGYNKKMLDFYQHSKPGRFESIEGIDTLRFIDYGKKLQFIPVEDCRTLSVDTEMDLAKVREIIAGGK